MNTRDATSSSTAPAKPWVVDRALLRLRPVSENDVDDILGWVNDQDIVGNLAAFAGKALTRDEELAWVRKVLTSSDERVFTALRASDGLYLGQVGLHQIYWRSKVARASAIVCSREQMGKGYGSAALAALLDVAFHELALHKVWLMVFEKNERSRRTYQRLGFVEEGVLRDEYFHQGAWHNMVRMGLLAKEWH